MGFYLILPIFGFFAEFKYTRLVSCLLLYLILCLGYTVGSDWRGYERIYTYWNFDDYQSQFGAYAYLVDCFKRSNIDFWVFHILLKSIAFVVLLYQLLKVRYALSIALGFYMIYLFVDNPMRNLLALVISLIAVNFYSYNKLLWLILLLLAVWFHPSALVSIILILPTKRLKQIAILMLPLAFIAVVNLETIISVLLNSRFLFFLLGTKVNFYLIEIGVNGTSGITVGMLFRFVVLLGLLKSRDKRLVYLYLIYLFIYLGGNVFDVMYRFQLFFIIIFCQAVIEASRVLIMERTQFIRLLLLMVIIQLNIYVEITRVEKFLPYTNILWYDGGQSFEERSNYNFR